MDHVKWKWQRCFMSQYPRAAFFSTGHRHLISWCLKIDSFRPQLSLPLLLLQPPPPTPLSVYRLLLGSLTLLCPVFASMCQTKPYVSVWGRDIRILYVSRLIEAVALIKIQRWWSRLFHRAVNLTSEPIEMLAKVTGWWASLKMTFYGQYERQPLSLVIE